MLLNSIFKHDHNQNTMTFAFVLEKRLANHNRSYLHIEDLKLPQQQQQKKIMFFQPNFFLISIFLLQDKIEEMQRILKRYFEDKFQTADFQTHTCTDECPQRTWCYWWQTHRGSPLLSSCTDPSWRCTPPDLQCPRCPGDMSPRQSPPASCRSPADKSTPNSSLLSSVRTFLGYFLLSSQ